MQYVLLTLIRWTAIYQLNGFLCISNIWSPGDFCGIIDIGSVCLFVGTSLAMIWFFQGSVLETTW